MSRLLKVIVKKNLEIRNLLTFSLQQQDINKP